MGKLTINIKSSSDMLSKNPILALGLKRGHSYDLADHHTLILMGSYVHIYVIIGYTTEDLRKQYRMLALKYHPVSVYVYMCNSSIYFVIIVYTLVYVDCIE